MRTSRPRTLCLAAAFAASGALAVQAQAQDAEPETAPALKVELNSATPLEGACRLTFMATNGLGVDVAKLVLETVLLTTDGVVDRLTLFDLQTLPANRPRVRQFDVAGLDCGKLGQVLINGVQACDGEGLDPATCTNELDLSTRADIEVLG
ncbi:hypothetical protein [Psychromarinibacter sp. S121]|uniref:hypothetical protein n=1 Tax=Psychromarinibacter sp. S121 TaxID=3415127 RepID=UPI003C7C9D28